MKKRRIVIIGAGPTGLGAAHRLAELGHLNFKVYDRQSYVGGLATSFHNHKGYTWDLAVHVAHSHYHYVDRLMDRLLPDGFYHHVRKSWVREYGAWIPYPFQYNVRHLPEAARQECIEGLVRLRNEPDKLILNFRDWILATAGHGIAKHFMIPYNRKIWTVDPAEMNAHWIGDRVPSTDLARVMRNIEEQKDDVSWGPNSTFQFPKTGGTGAIWTAMAAQLPAGHIQLSTELLHVDPINREAHFSDGTIENYDHLISTMPINLLTSLCGRKDLETLTRQLVYTTVDVVGVAPYFPIPNQLKDKTWIYCPEDACGFYRVTPFSIFSPAHVPDISRTCSFLCEFSAPGGTKRDPQQLITDTVRGLSAIGLVDVDPGQAHFHLMRADFGYPVPTLERDAILGKVQPELEKLGIFSRGRFGGWKYEAANMDHSIMQGVEVVERILNNTPEVTLPTPHVVNSGKR